MKVLNKFAKSKFFEPTILLFVTLIAFIPLINETGFYWDDWSMLWFNVTQGGDGFIEAFKTDRPFLGNLYKVTTALGTDPLVWNIVTVFLRYAVTLSFFWCLRLLWNDRKRETFIASLLLAVYPGFKQMPIVYVWLNGFVMTVAYVLSYGMMLKAIQSGNKKSYLLWTAAGVILYAFCTLSTEYYTGLDICRGIVIWIALHHLGKLNGKSLFKKGIEVIKHWVPYLLVLGGFMFWRVFVFKFPGYQPVLVEELKTNPFQAFKNILWRIFEDAYTSSVGAWTEFIKFPNHIDFDTKSGTLFWLFFVCAAVFTAAVLWLKNEQNTRGNRWNKEALILSVPSIILTGIPYWVTYLPLRLEYPYDRFLVAYMFGGCLLVVLIAEKIFAGAAVKRIVYSIVIGAAVGGNILNANSYRKDWAMQKDFTNQLLSRIPELEEGTVLLSDTNPMKYESDNSLTGLVNIALAPDNKTLAMPYEVDLYTPRFGTLEGLHNEMPVTSAFRSAEFVQQNDNIVVYSYSPPACLRVVDKEHHGDLPIFPQSYDDFLYLSDLSLIKTAAEPDTFIMDNIFKSPITENWCYWFQKADIASNKGDWEQVAEIGDNVLNSMKAGEGSEYLVYAEAYARLGRWNDAVDLLKRAIEMNYSLSFPVCDRFRKIYFEVSPGDNVITLLNGIGCSLYKNF